MSDDSPSSHGGVALRILFDGPQWHGSNAKGLADGFRRLGHICVPVDQDRYVPTGRGLASRAVRRLMQPAFVRDFNRAVLYNADRLDPHLLVVFKGAYIVPETIQRLKDRGIWTCVFYPDVSFMVHGSYIPRALPLYDHVFTTKSFGIEDMRSRLGVHNATLLYHGFDPTVHRPLPDGSVVPTSFHCDVSFVGGWSAKKEEMILSVCRTLPDAKVNVWGTRWDSASAALKARLAVTGPIYGDMYAAAIQASRINLGLLHERVLGASSGDQVTSRTFHIPAAGGFMLHERTDELAKFFTEGKEVACFDGPEELAEKVAYYLGHDDERERIRLIGHQRCVSENSLVQRAQVIVNCYREHAKRHRQGPACG